MSPSFHTAFQYYLTNSLHFSNLDFSLKSLASELFFFIGILLLNTVFKNTKRAKFLKIVCFLYIVTNMMLIPLLTILSTNDTIPPIAPVLFYTGLHAMFFEIFSLPVVGIFLEICPPNIEGFFMSLIFFMNNFSKNIGGFLGTVCIYLFQINSKDLAHLSSLIIIHFSFSFFGFCFLLVSYVPEKKTSNRCGEEIQAIENSHLAHINSKDSIVLEADDEASGSSHLNEWRRLNAVYHPEKMATDKPYMSFHMNKINRMEAYRESDSIN